MYDGSMLEDLQTIRMTILVSAVGDILWCHVTCHMTAWWYLIDRGSIYTTCTIPIGMRAVTSLWFPEIPQHPPLHVLQTLWFSILVL
jgi:hypothetical protein